MGLFLFECRKIFLQKGFAAILLLCAFLNLFLLNYSVKDSSVTYKPEEYRKMAEELRSLPMQEAYDRLRALDERLKQEDVYYLSEVELRKLCLYTGDLWNERDLIQAGLEELENAMHYNTYLKGIQEDANKMLGVSIFRKNTGYSARNLKKTAKDFKEMEDLTLQFDVSQGIIWATGFAASDLLGILLLFAAGIFLILNEKQNGQLAAIVCTARGRWETKAAKIGVLFLASIVIAGIIYGENFIYTWIVYGFGDLSRFVQSIPEYHSCILKISVLQYFMLFFAVKVLVYFAIGLLVFCFCLCFQQLLKIFGGFLALIGLETAAWYWIPVNSVFSALKYLNLFYFLQTDKLLMNYQNVNIFSRPVGSIPAAAFCLSIFMGICICKILYETDGSRIMIKKRLEGSPDRIKGIFQSEKSAFANCLKSSKLYGSIFWLWDNRFVFRKLGRVRSLAGFEYLKIVRKSGGLFLLFLFLIVQYYRIQDYTYLRLPEQIYYRTYMNYLAGPVTEWTDAYVKEENERYDSLSLQLMKLQQQDSSGVKRVEIQEKMRPYEAWEKVNAEYDAIVMRQQESGRTLFLVYGDGYRQLAGEDQDTDMTTTAAFFISLILVLLTAGTFSCDSGQDMDRIIAATSLGKRDTLRAKKKIAYFLAVISFLFVYGADFLKVYMEIGLNQFSAPVQSLSYLSGCTLSLNLGQYLLLLYMFRLIGIFVVVHGILAISLLCKSTIRSMLVSSIIFLLPTVLGLLHISIANKVTLLPMLTGGEIVKACLTGDMDVYMAGIISLGLIVFLGSEFFMRYLFPKG